MPSPPQALDLEKFLPYRLSILAQAVSDSLHALYADRFGLTVTQWRVMAALGRFAPLTASEVGQYIVMDKVAVSRAVTALLRRGLVERITDRTDRRRASLRLSPRGRSLHARIVPIALAFEKRLTAVLDARDRRTLDELTDRLLARARALAENAPPQR